MSDVERFPELIESRPPNANCVKACNPIDQDGTIWDPEAIFGRIEHADRLPPARPGGGPREPGVAVHLNTLNPATCSSDHLPRVPQRAHGHSGVGKSAMSAKARLGSARRPILTSGGRIGVLGCTRLRSQLNGLLLGRMVVMLLTLQFGVDIAYAGPVIRTVSSKGQDSGDCVAHACRTIQFAIDTATDGDTIRVLRGLYNEQLTIDSRNSLLIDGVGASKTIIEGNHSASQVRIGDSTNIEIRNLAIRNGGILRSNEGGGVQVLGSSVKLHNLILAENEAVNGGAVAVENGAINITNCLIVANEDDNSGGGVSVNIASNANIESSTIADNSGTFVAGEVSNQGKLVVSNSIVWGNSLAQIGNLPPGVSQVHFSDVQDGQDRVGNLDEDPLFRNPQAGNYRLDSSSPAIDAGTNAGAPATDLDGRLRPLDGNRDGLRIGDMGAFEFRRAARRDRD